MTEDCAFSARQVWTYRGAVPEGARVVIGTVDRLEALGSPGPVVVSISIGGVRLSDPGTGEIRQEAIHHCPISSEVLATCVVARDGVGQTADGYEEGYARWRQDLDAGEAGFFTIPVSEIVELYRNALGLEHPAK